MLCYKYYDILYYIILHTVSTDCLGSRSRQDLRLAADVALGAGPAAAADAAGYYFAYHGGIYIIRVTKLHDSEVLFVKRYDFGCN